MPAPRKLDHGSSGSASPTVVTNGQSPEHDPRAQSGDFLTTAQGLRLPDTDHSLKAGARGPTLLEDFHLREKISRDPGVEVAKEIDKDFTANLAAALGLHRVWDRAADVASSFVPPAA